MAPIVDRLSDREEAAKLLLAQQTIKNLASAAEKSRRADAAGVFTKVGQREAPDLDGVSLGTVAMERGVAGWRLRDPWEFLSWVMEHRPAEVVPTVSDAFTASVNTALTRRTGVTSEKTGEEGILDIPGWEWSSANPKLVVRPSKEAPELILKSLGDLAAALGFTPPPREVES